MELQGKVGPVASTNSLGNGSLATLRQGNMGDLIVSQLHDKNYEAAVRRALFTGSMQAVIATATIAGLSTTVTGVPVLYNPIGSGMVLAISKVGIGFVLAPAAQVAFGIATGFHAGTALSGTLTSLAPKSRYIGVGAPPAGQLYCSATITLPAAPTVDIVLGTLGQGAVTTSQFGAGDQYPIDGAILLPPGAYALIWTSGVVLASSLIAGFSWEEIPMV